jgi:hypothetical protein
MIPFVLTGLALLIAAMIFLYYNSGFVATMRTLRKTPKQLISSFEDGDVGKMVGTVQEPETSLIAPLSGTKCVYYRLHVESKRSIINSRRKTLIDEWEVIPFQLQDSSGRASIEVDPFVDAIQNNVEQRVGMFKKPSDEQQELLNKYLEDNRSNPVFSKMLIFTVTTLDVGEIAAIWGEATWNENDAGKKTLTIGAGQGPVLISDALDTLN